jgi:hypothetical protein
LRATKFAGPTLDPEPYVGTATYIADGHPNGVVIMGSQLNNRVVGIGGWPVRLVQIDVPQLALQPPFNDPATYDPVTAETAFPKLGVVARQLEVRDSVYLIQLSSNFPNSQYFERRLNSGPWTRIPDLDILPVGQCRVEYRSVDAMGILSATAVLDVWVPRASGFAESGLIGSVRSQTQLCMPSGSSP